MELNVGELIGFAIGIATTFIAAFWALLSQLFKQFEEKIARQFASLEGDAKEWDRVEKEWLRFQAELPIQYVRREDFVRNQNIIEAKLDTLSVKLENIQLRDSGRS